MIIRPMQRKDNGVVGAIIQQVLEEFNANKPGTAYYDQQLYELYNVFSTVDACYRIAELNGRVVGGAGIFSGVGLPPGYCELVKLYLLPEARGKGWGRLLIESCLASAKEMCYTHVYLETMPELSQAVPLYERMKFRYLPEPLGESGHFGCSIWMVKDLYAGNASL